MPLSDVAISNLKPTGRLEKHYDGGGLHLVMSPTGGKSWRFSYRFNGAQRLLSIGKYPAITLKQAREKHRLAKTMLEEGVDPAKHKQETKKLNGENLENSFANVAKEWHMKFLPTWTEKHGNDIWVRLSKNVLKYLGQKPIGTIKPSELLAVLRRIENRGALEQAHRVMQICGNVFRYAVATDRAERDITADLRGAIPPKKVKHHASITEPKEVGRLLLAMEDYTGHFAIECAMKLSPLVFVRPSELRCAEWKEFDFEAAEWRVPAERMKMKEKHIVPLARQTIAILTRLKELTGHTRYLFPSMRTDERPMSNNTVNAALRRIGYSKEELTAHGFRSMASTLLNELGWNRDAIERQLAHAERNKIRAAYNFAEFLPERRLMMQAWADHLDELRDKARANK